MAIFNSYVKLPEGRLLKKQLPDASWTSSFQRIQRTMENHENTSPSSPSSPSSTKVQQHIHPKPRPGQGQAKARPTNLSQSLIFLRKPLASRPSSSPISYFASNSSTGFRVRRPPGSTLDPATRRVFQTRQRGRSHNQVRSPENLQACPILPHITTIYH